MKKILLIEDDTAVSEGLKESFRQEHFEVLTASNGEDGFKMAKTEKVDLILLDLVLPDIDGTDVCRGLRTEGIQTPIIMLTGRKDEIDKIIGLEIGADDYVTKPFSARELILRVKAILRRVDDYKSQITKNFKFADIEVDFKKMEIKRNGEIITLSVMEMKVLKYLIEKKGEVATRDDLLNDVWGYDVYPTTRTVDNYILALRKKIEDNYSDPVHIVTVPKAGYKFVDH